MAKGVAKTYRRVYKKNLAAALELLADVEDAQAVADDVVGRVEAESRHIPSLIMDATYVKAERDALIALGIDEDKVDRAQAYAAKAAYKDTDRTTFQAMEAFIHNLNTMHSRAGAQTPFSSINYGMDTSAEGRMVMKNILLATEQGLGHGETPIFPIPIFRVKEGITTIPAAQYALFNLAASSPKEAVPQLLVPGRALHLSTTMAPRRPRYPTWAAAPRVLANGTNPPGSPTVVATFLHVQQPAGWASGKGDTISSSSAWPLQASSSPA